MQARWIVGVVAVALALPGVEAGAAPGNWVGVNAHQPAGDVLDAAKSLGVRWVRIDFNWFQVRPSAAKTDWSLFDKLINEAHKRGLEVFPTLGYGPAWASEKDTDGKPHNNVPKAGMYQAFCKAAAARYKGKITHWGLWNEPNLHFFEGTRQQWIDRVVLEGVKGVKAGCPTCKVLGPELASVGKDYDKWLADALKALKKAGLMYDIITWHIYSSFKELEPAWACWNGDLFEHDLDKHRVCLVVHGPLSVREVLVNHKLSSLPVWVTETGFKAPVSDAKATASQVVYYRRVLEEQLERPWWTHTFFYEIVDDNAIADKWGMAARSGSKPAFPGSYKLKPVWALVSKALGQQPAFGGTGTDCSDGLDNDGDKLIDYPKDPQCASAKDPSEGKTVAPDAGVDAAPAGDGAAADGPPADGPAPTVDGGASTDGPAPGEGGPAGDSGAEGDDAGCGCATTPGAPTPVQLALILLVVVAALRRGRTAG